MATARALPAILEGCFATTIECDHQMSTYTPITTFETASERDWPYHLGLLDWDDTKIVFTKRQLIEFLKYTGTTVDTNYGNIGKLPRYCTFGKVGDAASAGGPAESEPLPTTTRTASASVSGEAPKVKKDEFIPTRIVREPPGGKSSMASLLGGTEDSWGVKAPPPKKPVQDTWEESTTTRSGNEEAEASKTDKVSAAVSQATDRLFGTKDPDEFIPTRRVRERPGGKDNMSEIFG